MWAWNTVYIKKKTMMFQYNWLAACQEAGIANVRSFTYAGNQQTTASNRTA